MPLTALVTGASSGIGEAFARALAAKGYNLILVARRVSRLEALAKEVAAPGIQATVIPMDLSQPEGPANLFKAVAEAGLTVDLLINNAGVGCYGLFAETPWQKTHEMLVLNIQALTELTRLFLPAMRERKSGAIIQVASTAAFQAIPYFAVYAATKAYVLSFSEALALEAAKDGVQVLCLAPGPTTTEFATHADVQAALLEKAGAMSAEEVVTDALRALENRRTLSVPGVMNAMTAASVRLLPRHLVARIAGLLAAPGPKG